MTDPSRSHSTREQKPRYESPRPQQASQRSYESPRPVEFRVRGHYICIVSFDFWLSAQNTTTTLLFDTWPLTITGVKRDHWANPSVGLLSTAEYSGLPALLLQLLNADGKILDLAKKRLFDLVQQIILLIYTPHTHSRQERVFRAQQCLIEGMKCVFSLHLDFFSMFAIPPFSYLFYRFDLRYL